jgi:ribosome-binding factor A
MSEGGQGPRRKRVAQAILTNIAEMLAREVKDPRIHAAGLVSVHKVELNRDMSVARVHVSFFTEAGVDRAMDGLNAAAKFLRGPLGRRLKLARTPELRFMHDTSPKFGERLTEIVLEDEARAKEAERDGDGED